MKSLLLSGLFGFLSLTAYSQHVVTLVDDLSTKFSDALIFDDQGNLFCADYSGTSVYKRTPDGTVTTFATGMDTPNGMAFDSNGNMFICDNQGDAIYKISDTGIFLDTFPTSKPSGIIKDIASDTMIFTVYSNQHELKKLAPDGTIYDFHSGAPLNGPVGLCYVNDELYAGNFNDRKIIRIEADTMVYIATVPGPTNGYLGFIATAGNTIFGTSWNSSKIYEVIPTETDSVIYFAGGDNGSQDGPLLGATFSQPNGIIANETGDTLYVSQYSSGKLRMIAGVTLNTVTMEIDAVRVFPNPANEYVTVDFASLQDPIVEIYSGDGKLLDTVMNPSSQLEKIHLPTDNGLYFLKVSSDRSSKMFKIIKQ